MNKKTQHFVLVGSGVAGAILAEELLSRGLGSVTMLEAGKQIEMRNQRKWLDLVLNGQVPYSGCEDSLADLVPVGAAPWQIKGGRLFGRGGSTIHWGGWSPRFKPEDFAYKASTGRGVDWPFDYASLEKFYCRAESKLQVAGNSKSTIHPPRTEPYPFEAAPYTQTDGVVIDALESMQLEYDHMPIARNTKAINGHPACMTVGTCGYCPIGARYSADQTLDRLERHNQFTLHLNSPVVRVQMRTKSSVAAVHVADALTGTTKAIEGDVFILCAGALETPKLLLNSASNTWPHGIGNDTGYVGAYLMAHPYLYCRGSRNTNPRKLQQELHFATLCSRAYDTESEQPAGKFFFNKAYTAPDVDLAKWIDSRTDVGGIASSTEGSHSFELQGAMEPLAWKENCVSSDSGTTSFGLPRTRITTPKELYTTEALNKNLERLSDILVAMGYTITQSGVYPQRGDHALGTCRMSTSDTDGVVDETLRVHNTQNLYVCSNAVFPSASASNPTLTLVALALRLVDHLHS